MPDAMVGHIEEPSSLEPIFSTFERDHPGLRIGCGYYEGSEDELVTEYEGVRYIWIDQGVGELLLESGYRTQEGDGEKLPSFYKPDVCDSETWPILQVIAENLDTLHEPIRQPVEAILNRISGRTLIGDISGDIRQIVTECVAPDKWSKRPKVRRALELLLENFSVIGWSTKGITSFEEIKMGDQLIVEPDEPLRVRGGFRYWWIENTKIFMSHLSSARRLRHLRNTIDEHHPVPAHFRRLPMTWYCNPHMKDNSDGINAVNSHVVNIVADYSRTHYHPSISIPSGRPRHEIYFVLDPAVYSLNPSKRESYLHIFPDIQNLTQQEKIPVRPGSIVYILPDTGHRGIDVFANIVALPGFKPHNDVQLDQHIKERTGGKSPYNEHVTH